LGVKEVRRQLSVVSVTDKQNQPQTHTDRIVIGPCCEACGLFFSEDVGYLEETGGVV
jgi:hypothetical protein